MSGMPAGATTATRLPSTVTSVLHCVDRSTDANVPVGRAELCSRQEPAFALEDRHRCVEPTPCHQSEFRPESIVGDSGDEVDHPFSVAAPHAALAQR